MWLVDNHHPVSVAWVSALLYLGIAHSMSKLVPRMALRAKELQYSVSTDHIPPPFAVFNQSLSFLFSLLLVVLNYIRFCYGGIAMGRSWSTVCSIW
jgi:hypothetical protein